MSEPEKVTEPGDGDQSLTSKGILGSANDTSSNAFRALSTVLNNRNWTPEERKGVASLLLAVQLAYSYDDAGQDLQDKRRHWAEMLSQLGIVFRGILRDKDNEGDETMDA